MSQIHDVKTGENLSHDILGKQIPGPVWGEEGSFKKVLKLNPNLKTPDLIFPGQKIILPISPKVVDEPIASEPTKDESSIKAIEPILSDRRTFWFAPSYFSTMLDAEDEKSGESLDLVSEHAIGLEVGMGLPFQKNLSWLVQANYEFYDFNTTSINLKKDKFSTFGGTIGIQWAPNEKMRFNFYSSLQQKLFIQSIDQSVYLDNLFVPFVGAAMTSQLMNTGPVFIGWNLQGGMNLTPLGESSAKNGYQYRLGLFFERNSLKKPYKIFPEIYYLFRDQDVNGLNQNQQALGLNLRYEF